MFSLRALAALILAALIGAVSPAVFAVGEQSVLNYTKINDGTQIEITDCNESASGYLEVPAVIEGLPVTAIAEEAFFGCAYLTGIGVPLSVSSIGPRAFINCRSLRQIDVAEGNLSFCSADGVLFTKDRQTLLRCPMGKSGAYEISGSTVIIGNDAFYGCVLLTEITVPDSVTTLNNGAFYDCSGLSELLLPDSVLNIGWSTFVNCTSLTTMGIPEGVSSIGYYAFRGCASLKSVTIPGSVTVIGSYAFRDCVSLESVIIPNGVTSLKGFAFYGCTSLSEVSLPDALTSIAGYAFYACPSLKSIAIPRSVTAIGNNVFGYAINGERIEEFKVYCYKNSAGERYAKENGFACEINGGLTLELKPGTDMEIMPEGFVVSRKAEITASALTACFYNNGIAIFKDGVRLKPEELAGTGCEIRLYDGTALIDVLTFVVIGDVDKNGLVESADAQIVLRAAANLTEPLKGAQLLAADVTGGGVGVDDARKILRAASKLE